MVAGGGDAALPVSGAVEVEEAEEDHVEHQRRCTAAACVAASGATLKPRADPALDEVSAVARHGSSRHAAGHRGRVRDAVRTNMERV